MHLQAAGNRSFASAPLTVTPNARSCATCANFASSRPTLLTAADLLNALLPALSSSSACGAQIPSSLAHSGAPRVRSPRREGACSISPESGGCPVINSLALVLTVACSGTRTLAIARLECTIGQDSRQGLTKAATADGRPVHQHRVKGDLPRCDSLANRPWRLSQRDEGNADPRLLKHVVCLRLGPAITHPCTLPQSANAHCLQAVGVPTCCNKHCSTGTRAASMGLRDMCSASIGATRSALSTGVPDSLCTFVKMPSVPWWCPARGRPPALVCISLPPIAPTLPCLPRLPHWLVYGGVESRLVIVALHRGDFAQSQLPIPSLSSTTKT